MSTEAGLWAAIAARPDDAAPRLAYADWLDEHGDPRAELVRVEEELRRLPASADRYWALKPRRNELRAGCAPAWLAAMGYGTSYHPVFTDWPDDWRSRWRLVRELIERWYRVPMPDVGGRAEEVLALQKRIGRRLPRGVGEWYTLATDIGSHPEAEEVLRDGFGTDTIHFCTDMPVLELLRQAEGDIIWGVTRKDLSRPDPPVTVYFLDYESEGPARFVVHEVIGSVSEFALGYILSYLNGDSGSFGTSVNIDPDFVRQLEGYFSVHLTVGGLTVYERGNVLARYRTPGRYFQLDLRRPMTPDALPAFLRRLV